MRYNSFHPGKVWLDTEGKRIHAHGGSVMLIDDTWYWYGENKEYTDGKSGIWTWGVRCYSSKDLYNWEDRGLIIEPDLEDKTSPLNPYHAMMDRPHILYNKKTGKYVCWVKVMRKDGSQTESVLTADSILGPYTLVRSNFKPLGMNAGDFDLYADEDGKGYYLFEHVHSETIIAELTDDYTDVNGTYTRHFPHPCPPYVREATAHMKRDGKHYLLTSGTTGYLPNPSEAAVADEIHGPYTILGNPHPDDTTDTSFHSQISCIFKVPGKKDLYIACADRWAPNALDYPYSVYAKTYEMTSTGKAWMIPLHCWSKGTSFRKFLAMTGDGKRATVNSDYVWLPIRFDGEKVRIDWREEWSLEEFE